jgi:hypothetical protein
MTVWLVGDVRLSGASADLLVRKSGAKTSSIK